MAARPARSSTTVNDSCPAIGTTKPTVVDVVWKGAILVALVALVALARRFAIHSPFTALIDTQPLVVRAVALAFSGVTTIYGALTIVHAVRYRPAARLDDAELPTCTVIVPAFNEGAMVRIALRSALESDYPQDKLHVIAIDDGSTDDTWEHIAEVARAQPGRVTTVRRAKNAGKREALQTGFQRARGAVVVTVDSDSKLAPGALRSLVGPLKRDERVAAVAGKVLVLNRYEGVLTRLLAARFFLTFDLARAAQSRFGAVLCCPGALTAYRRRAVLEVLEAWSTQTFLGSPCTIGEDRALMTWLLRAGYRSVYQSTAIVETIVPTTIRGVARMMLRWERGNVRESLVFLPTLLTRWRDEDRLWPTFEVVFDLVQLPLGYAVLASAIGGFAREPGDALGVLALMGVIAFVQSLWCLRSEPSTDFIYNVGYVLFALVGLQWLFPYSCLTLRDGRWLTRG